LSNSKGLYPFGSRRRSYDRAEWSYYYQDYLVAFMSLLLCQSCVWCHTHRVVNWRDSAHCRLKVITAKERKAVFGVDTVWMICVFDVFVCMMNDIVWITRVNVRSFRFDDVACGWFITAAAAAVALYLCNFIRWLRLCARYAHLPLLCASNTAGSFYCLMTVCADW